MALDKDKVQLVKQLKDKFGNVVSRKDVLSVTKRRKNPIPRWLFNTKTYRGKERGTYDLTKVEKAMPSAA